jgi:uncharacterized protein with HEPN domain
VRDRSLVLQDLIAAVERLIELGAERAADPADDRDRDEAILFNVIVMGEAATRSDPSTRAGFPGIPWDKMAQTRDRVVHHYEGVDWRVIDTILADDLPDLLPRLRAVRDSSARDRREA